MLRHLIRRLNGSVIGACLLLVLLTGCEVKAPQNSAIQFGHQTQDEQPLPDVVFEDSDSVEATPASTDDSESMDVEVVDDGLDDVGELDESRIAVVVSSNSTADVDEVDTDDDVESDAHRLEENDSTPLPLLIEIHVSDMWGQGIENARVLLETDFDESLIPERGERYALHYGGDFRLSVSANYYEHAELFFEYDGQLDASGVSMWRDNDVPYGFVLRSSWANDDMSQQILHVHVGLPHRFFASSGHPIRRDGDFRLYRDGQTAWTRVYRALQQAQEHIHVTAWWWESDFELLRRLALGEREHRRANTILSVLERSPAQKRILLWSHPALSQFNVDDDLVDHAGRHNDIEVMGIHNETTGHFLWSMPSIDYLARLARHSELDPGRLVTDRPVYLDIDDRWVDYLTCRWT